ncbi:DUF4837 family protein [Tenacibaculum sp. UWU-22]|uniref:DUF4837 family protein n=1 Tax=Tenacibaculum sp. UWU-22 TaxID=3234187 RepID=UPI0034DB76AF
MKKLITLYSALAVLYACKQKNSTVILPSSIGKTNHIEVVMKSADWDGISGDKIRTVFGEHQVGLPQPETLLSVSQIDPKGFANFMRNNKSVLIVNQGDDEGIKVVKDKYAVPQTLVYLTAKNEKNFVNLVQENGKKIIKIFKDFDIKILETQFAKDKWDDKAFKTLDKLGISLTIPKSFKVVEDNGEFLWLRQHLKSGIARGDGSNNILVYTSPLTDPNEIADNITTVRDSIGKKYIPGSDKGMYMITEQAYTPFTYDAVIDGLKAYETRGKWEVKNDFMAGPFLNYTIIDKKNNRLVVFEGFTYAPSVNKRDFIFELEAIAKSIKIK